MSDADDPSGKIKVVDRRRFDDDGEIRFGWEGAEEPAPETDPGPPSPQPRESQPPPAEAPQRAPEHTPGEPTSATSPSFLNLVSFIAQQAAVLLNGTDELPSQPDLARQMIDFLDVLEEKTHGNLSVEESRLLSGVIHQLKYDFVQRKQ